MMYYRFERAETSLLTVRDLSGIVYIRSQSSSYMSLNQYHLFEYILDRFANESPSKRVRSDTTQSTNGHCL